MNKFLLILLSFVITGSTGCGYSTKSLLPDGLDSIYVTYFENDIDPAKEVSNRRSSYTYWPGLEIDITRAVIDGFIFDRHLTIERENESALLLKGQLMDFRQVPLSYDGSENIVEFRIEVRVDLQLYNQKTGEEMWKESSFMGQSDYTISGPNSKTEAEAVRAAVKDLAQRVVERTVEAW